MNEEPSSTALTAAAARAAHLIVDRPPVIFSDTLASALLGERADELLDYHRHHGDHLVLSGARAQVVIRSRYTEDRLAEAARGLRLATGPVDQYVILGAGLDTYAYRTEDRGVHVFEVDHPASQRWKRRHLADAGIEAPPTVTFVPADLEKQPVVEALADTGFDAARPAFVSWLGVIGYLTREAVSATLAQLGGLAPGSELVADYSLPKELRDADGDAYAEAVRPHAADRNEPWRTELSPADIAALLGEHGFDVVEDVPPREAIDPALWNRTDAFRSVGLSRLVHARVRGTG